MLRVMPKNLQIYINITVSEEKVFFYGECLLKKEASYNDKVLNLKQTFRCQVIHFFLMSHSDLLQKINSKLLHGANCSTRLANYVGTLTLSCIPHGYYLSIE